MMGEHQSNPKNRLLQTVGAKESYGQNFGWYYGTHNDFFMELPTGRIIVEVCRQPNKFQVQADDLWTITYLDEIEPSKPYQPLFYVTRTAARNAVEERFAEKAGVPAILVN